MRDLHARLINPDTKGRPEFLIGYGRHFLSEVLDR